MSARILRALEVRLLQEGGGSLDSLDVELLVSSAQLKDGISQDERLELAAMLRRDRFDGDAQEVLTRAIRKVEQEEEADGRAPVARLEGGTGAGDFEGASVYLGADGRLEGDSGVDGYSRSYVPTYEGLLRFRHGSSPPLSNVPTRSESNELRSVSPGKALDLAAAALGKAGAGFEALASSPEFYDPDAPKWFGVCHAWAWSALSNRLTGIIDAGSRDKRHQGLWIGGQWLSRADLGNWMMAVASELSPRVSSELFKKQLSPEDLLKGTVKYMTHHGGGVVGDVWNDERRDSVQIWNQPFLAADVTTQTLSGEAAAALLDEAVKDGVVGGTAVKHVDIMAHFAAETDAKHEGSTRLKPRNWHLYAVTNAQGRVLKAYMADDERLEDIPGLPVKRSEEVPDYFRRPDLRAIDDAFSGRANPILDTDLYAAQFRFFVGTVLGKGVPGDVRAAFEKELAELPEGFIEEEKVQELSARYPGVANAYARAQWNRSFGTRGLEAARFGAIWDG